MQALIDVTAAACLAALGIWLAHLGARLRTSERFWGDMSKLIAASFLVFALAGTLTVEGRAFAANVVRAVGALIRTPDGRYDESCPTGDCAPTTVAWTAGLATAMTVVSSQNTGTATDIDLSAYCTGINCGSAAYRLHTAVTNWSVGGSGTKHLLHAGVAAGSSGVSGPLILDACYPSAPTCNTSSSFNWSYTVAAITDTTPPTNATGIALDSVGTLQVTLSVDAVMDPGNSVNRSSLATYNFKRNGVLIDAKAAPSAGTACDFTGTSIGSPAGSLSAVQGSGASGGQWTVNGGGFGQEHNAADSLYGIFCPVSGSTVYLIDRIDSLPNVLTYNKSIARIGNAVGGAGAAFWSCVIMRIGSTYYLQPAYRLANGGNGNSGSPITLPGTPPYYRRTGDVGTTGTCDYSTDGGTWTAASSLTITLNDAKSAGFGASATSTGSDAATITTVEGFAAVQTAGRITDTISVASGTATFTATVSDSHANESTAIGSVVGTPTAPATNAVKYNIGQYLWDGAISPSLATEQTFISGICANTNIRGIQVVVQMRALEGDTLGDYSAGFAFVDGVIAALTPCHKQLMLSVNHESFGALATTVNQATAYAHGYYPLYLSSATYGTCCATQVGGSYMYGAIDVPISGQAPSYVAARTLLHLWTPSVMDRWIALQHAYLTRYDSNPYFEMYTGLPETALGDQFIDTAAYATQVGRLIDAGAVDGPHTIVRIGTNFMNTDSQMKFVFDKCSASPNCIAGGPDPLYSGYLLGTRTAGYVQAPLIYSGASCGGCTAHDYRSAMRMLQEVQWDGVYIGTWLLSGGSVPTACDEFVANVRAGAASAGLNAAYSIWDVAGPATNCYNPAGAQTGIIDSINANHNPDGTTGKPGNFPATQTNPN